MAYDDDFFENDSEEPEEDYDAPKPRKGGRKSRRGGGGGGNLPVIILLVLALALGGLNGYQFIQQRDARQQIRELKEELALKNLEIKNLQNAPSPAPTQAPAQPSPAPAQAPGQPASGGAFSPAFTFSTDDRDGVMWDESVFADHTLTMINFWEPWCGPCVNEMGDLQRLYEDYADQGFLILGVYSEQGMESDVVSVLSSTGVKYPILHYTPEFDRFQSGYVPTTIFVDQTGRDVTRDLTGEDLLVGSRSYSAWAAIVTAGLS